MKTRLGIFFLVAVLLQPPMVAAQDLTALISEGRFDEAAAMLSAVGPVEAEAGARAIFRQAYVSGYQLQDYEYAIRGMSAAKRVPGVGDSLGQQLDFWHGFSMYALAVLQAEPQTYAAAQATLPIFRESLALLSGTAEYAAANNINIPEIRAATEQWIQILETIVQRGA